MSHYRKAIHRFGATIILEQDGRTLSFMEDPENTDYQRYLAWLAEGNTPEVIEA